MKHNVFNPYYSSKFDLIIMNQYLKDFLDKCVVVPSSVNLVHNNFLKEYVEFLKDSLFATLNTYYFFPKLAYWGLLEVPKDCMYNIHLMDPILYPFSLFRSIIANSLKFDTILLMYLRDSIWIKKNYLLFVLRRISMWHNFSSILVKKNVNVLLSTTSSRERRYVESYILTT